jgi:hypothetical protein
MQIEQWSLCQCCGSGTARTRIYYDRWIRIQKGKYDLQTREKTNFFFWSAGYSLLRAEDLSSCSLAVFHGVLGINELHFLIFKKRIQLYNFKIFCHKNPSPDSHWNNADPQHWITFCGYVRAWWNRRPEDEFMNVQFRWVRRLEVSIYNGYITNQFQTTLLRGGGGGRE